MPKDILPYPGGEVKPLPEVAALPVRPGCIGVQGAAYPAEEQRSPEAH